MAHAACGRACSLMVIGAVREMREPLAVCHPHIARAPYHSLTDTLDSHAGSRWP